VLTFLLICVAAGVFGVGVGVLAWQVLGRWNRTLGPIALLVVIVCSASLALNLATGWVKRHNERTAVASPDPIEREAR
jgi:hypothetical protein